MPDTRTPGWEGLPGVGPFLGGDGEDVMVLPIPGDAQVPQCQPRAAESGLLEDPLRANVRQHRRGLDAMEGELAEGKGDGQLSRLRGIAASVDALGDVVPQVGVVEHAADDVVDGDSPDDLAGSVADREHLARAHAAIGDLAFDQLSLALEGEELRRPFRLPRAEEISVVQVEPEHAGRVPGADPAETNLRPLELLHNVAATASQTRRCFVTLAARSVRTSTICTPPAPRASITAWWSCSARSTRQ